MDFGNKNSTANKEHFLYMYVDTLAPPALTVLGAMPGVAIQRAPLLRTLP